MNGKLLTESRNDSRFSSGSIGMKPMGVGCRLLGVRYGAHAEARGFAERFSGFRQLSIFWTGEREGDGVRFAQSTKC